MCMGLSILVELDNLKGDSRMIRRESEEDNIVSFSFPWNGASDRVSRVLEVME